jgi:hypothetical protein
MAQKRRKKTIHAKNGDEAKGRERGEERSTRNSDHAGFYFRFPVPLGSTGFREMHKVRVFFFLFIFVEPTLTHGIYGHRKNLLSFFLIMQRLRHIASPLLLSCFSFFFGGR